LTAKLHSLYAKESKPLGSKESEVDILPRFCNLACLVNFPGTFWTHGRTNVAGIPGFGEVAQHSGLCEFHSCALCRKVSHHDFFAKIPSLPLGRGIIFFRSLYPRFIGEDRKKNDLKTDSSTVFESSRFVTTEQ